MRRAPRPHAASPVCSLLAAALLLGGCASVGGLGGPPAVAVVNGEAITESEVGRALGRLHHADSRRAPGEVSVTEFVERAIDDRLMLQDARRMGLFERSDVQAAVKTYLTREAVGRLYEEEVSSKVEVPEAEVREKFFAEYDEVGLLLFSYDEEEKAKECARLLREGASPAEAAAQTGLGEAPEERFLRRALVGEEFLGLFSMQPGEVLGPVAKQRRFLVVKLLQQRPASEEDFALYRPTIERPIRKLRERERGEAYVAELRARHAGQVDEALLATLPESVEGLAALKEDPRPVARVGEEVYTLGSLAAEVERSLRRHPEGRDSAEAARKIINAWVDARVVDAEALGRRYEERDPVLAADLEAYREDLVLRIYMSQVVVPRVELTDEAVKAYYEAHQQDYLKPARLKLRQMSFADPAKAAWAREELAKGADFSWLARTHSVDQLAERGGQLGWVGEDKLNPQALEAVKGLESGQASPVIHIGENYQILQLEEREAAAAHPLEEVERQVRADLYRLELEKARSEVAGRLREGAEIEVNRKGLARLKETLFGADGKKN